MKAVTLLNAMQIAVKDIIANPGKSENNLNFISKRIRQVFKFDSQLRKVLKESNLTSIT